MINLYILDPSNISEKHILEHNIQKEFYKNKNFKINYIPSLFPEYKYFNKFFSINEYLKNNDIKNESFYMDHDIFINNEKFIKNMFYNKIFLTYKKRQYFNWQKIFNEKINIEIKDTFTHRNYACFFPLYKKEFTDMMKLIQNFFSINKNNLIEYSGLIEEWFFTKCITDNQFKTLPIDFNQVNEKIYIMHYQISDKFKINFKKNLKNIKMDFKKLKEIYEKVK